MRDVRLVVVVLLLDDYASADFNGLGLDEGSTYIYLH